MKVVSTSNLVSSKTEKKQEYIDWTSELLKNNN